jgi:hypothetical protein
VLKGSNTSLDAVTTDLNLVSSVTVTVGGVDVDVEITSWNSSILRWLVTMVPLIAFIPRGK